MHLTSKHVFHVNQVVTWNKTLRQANPYWGQCIDNFIVQFGDLLLIEDISILDVISRIGAGHHQQVTVRSVSVPSMTDVFSGLWFMPIITGFSLDAIDD